MDAQDAFRARVVLVVEDDWLMREDAVNQLTAAGYLVFAVDAGEQALALIRAPARIDVLFTDIDLKGPITGFDIAQAFRATRPENRVIYTSGLTHERTPCVQDSVFLTKPYLQQELVAACA